MPPHGQWGGESHLRSRSVFYSEAMAGTDSLAARAHQWLVQLQRDPSLPPEQWAQVDALVGELQDRDPLTLEGIAIEQVYAYWREKDPEILGVFLDEPPVPGSTRGIPPESYRRGWGPPPLITLGRGYEPTAFFEVSDGQALELIGEALDIDADDVAALFEVDADEVARWRRDGVPAAYRARFMAVRWVIMLMGNYLAPGQLPAVARRPAAAYGGVTLIEALADDPAVARAAIERAFDWSGTA